MRRLVVLTVVAIAVLTGGLALYLYWVGTLLNRIAANAEDSADLVGKIDGHAKAIRPGVAHINRVGGVVAGALPLLYGMAEEIVSRVAAPPSAAPPASSPPSAGPSAGPSAERGGQSGPRRSRLHDGVGFIPPS